jgi:hypothetical protein
MRAFEDLTLLALPVAASKSGDDFTPQVVRIMFLKSLPASRALPSADRVSKKM